MAAATQTHLGTMPGLLLFPSFLLLSSPRCVTIRLCQTRIRLQVLFRRSSIRKMTARPISPSTSNRSEVALDSYVTAQTSAPEVVKRITKLETAYSTSPTPPRHPSISTRIRNCELASRKPNWS
jgi:hypothetical protein